MFSDICTVLLSDNCLILINYASDWSFWLIRQPFDQILMPGKWIADKPEAGACNNYQIRLISTFYTTKQELDHITPTDKILHISHQQRQVSKPYNTSSSGKLAHLTSNTTRGELEHITILTSPEKSQHILHHQRRVSTSYITREELAHLTTHEKS